MALNRFDDAEEVLLEGHLSLVDVVGSEHLETQKTIGSLIVLYDAWGKPDKAAEWRAKLPAEQEAVASDSASPADDKQDE